MDPQGDYIEKYESNVVRIPKKYMKYCYIKSLLSSLQHSYVIDSRKTGRIIYKQLFHYTIWKDSISI